MVKRIAVWIVAGMFFAGTVPAFAADKEKSGPTPNEEAYEHANERARFKRTEDAKGHEVAKTAKETEKETKKTEAEAEKAKKEAEQKAEKAKKEAEKAAEKAKKDAEKEAKKQHKGMKKGGGKTGKGSGK